MEFWQVVGVLAAVAAAFALATWLDKRAKRDPFLDELEGRTAVIEPPKWPAFAPDHGERFEYEGHVFAVVGVYDCRDPRGSPGIVCHFADQHGVVWEARFSAYQWDALSNYRNWLPRRP